MRKLDQLHMRRLKGLGWERRLRRIAVKVYYQADNLFVELVHKLHTVQEQGPLTQTYKESSEKLRTLCRDLITLETCFHRPLQRTESLGRSRKELGERRDHGWRLQRPGRDLPSYIPNTEVLDAAGVRGTDCRKLWACVLSWRVSSAPLSETEYWATLAVALNH